MKKIISLFMGMLSMLMFTSAFACGDGGGCTPPPTTGCGQTGCYSADGNMQIWLSNHTVAYGSEVLAASGGNYNFTTVLGTNALDKVDYINLNGGFMAVSEDVGYTEAGGYSFGEAAWSRVIRW